MFYFNRKREILTLGERERGDFNLSNGGGGGGGTNLNLRGISAMVKELFIWTKSIH